MSSIAPPTEAEYMELRRIAWTLRDKLNKHHLTDDGELMIEAGETCPICEEAG